MSCTAQKRSSEESDEDEEEELTKSPAQPVAESSVLIQNRLAVTL